MNSHFLYRKEAKYKSKLLKSPIAMTHFWYPKQVEKERTSWLDQIFFELEKVKYTNK